MRYYHNFNIFRKKNFTYFIEIIDFNQKQQKLPKCTETDHGIRRDRFKTFHLSFHFTLIT